MYISFVFWVIHQYWYLFGCSNCSSLAVGKFFSSAPMSPRCVPILSFFEHFLTLWRYKMLISGIFLTAVLEAAILQDACFILM